MPKTRPPYSAEFRSRMIDWVRAGRTPEDLAREFEPTAQLIQAKVVQADRKEGREEKSDGLNATRRDELARLRRENKELRLERDISPSGGLVRARDRGRAVRVFEFMSAHQAVFPIATMARVLGASKAGYHAWRHRSPCAHAAADAKLLKQVRTVRAGSRHTYGAPRVHAALRAEGQSGGRLITAQTLETRHDE